MSSFRSAELNLKTKLLNLSENENLTAKRTAFIFELFDELISAVSYYRPLAGKIRNYLQKAIYSSQVRSSNTEGNEYVPYFELYQFYLTENPEIKIYNNKITNLENELRNEKSEKNKIIRENSEIKLNYKITKNNLNLIIDKFDYLKENICKSCCEIKVLKDNFLQQKTEMENLFINLKEKLKVNELFLKNMSFYNKLYNKITAEFSIYLKNNDGKSSQTNFSNANKKAENIFQFEKSEKQLIEIHARLVSDLENDKSINSNNLFYDTTFKEASRQIFKEIDSIQKTRNSLEKDPKGHIFTKNNIKNNENDFNHEENSYFSLKNINENVQNMVSKFAFKSNITVGYTPRIIDKNILKKMIENFITSYHHLDESRQSFQEKLMDFLKNHYGSENTVSLIICDVCNSIDRHSDEYIMARIFKKCIINKSSVNIFYYVKLIKDHLKNFEIKNIQDFKIYISNLYPFFKDEDFANAELSFISFGNKKFSQNLVFDYIITNIANDREPRVQKLIKILRRYQNKENSISENKLLFTFKEIFENFDSSKFYELLKNITFEENSSYFQIEKLAEIAAYFDFKY